ncbi:putative mitochondrial-processing peptidase subunit beta, mitochondrial [Carex rostrata]
MADAVNARLKWPERPGHRFIRYASSDSYHTSIMATPETRVTTLPNGIRVATESRRDINIATVGVWIDAGSRFEAEETNGTAHFVEHMVFKGTESHLEYELMQKMKRMGGHFNAYTSREQTTYYAKVFYRNVSEALEIFADILQNSTFDDCKWEWERDDIFREIQKVEGQTEKVLFHHLHATAFQNTPLGRTILGSAENVKSITQEHLKNYITTQYTAPRMVISAAGAIEHDEVVELVKKLFTKLSSDPTTASHLVAKSPAYFTGSEVRIIDDDVKLAQFVVAFEGAAATDPDCIALMVMQAMLGSWSNCAGQCKNLGSELMRNDAVMEFSESVMTFNTNYKDTGLFGVYAVAKPDHLDRLSYAIMRSIGRLCYRVRDDDVTRAHNQLKYSLMLHLDSTTNVAEDIGCQILNYGRRIPAAELFARIDVVDANEVKRVANRFFFDQDVAIAAIGPVKGLPNYNWFREFTSTKISQNLC